MAQPWAEALLESWQGPLQERFPKLVEEATPVRLATLPTPVQRLEALGARVGHANLWVKRDDQTSTLYGGNKPRKLEFLLGEALRVGARTVLTMGGLGSNHLLATGLHGRSLGLRTVGVVFPQPLTENVRTNLAADAGAGIELVRTSSKYLLPAAVAAALGRIWLREGRRPWLIPGGGSSALGSLGFVNAGLELAAQVIAGECPAPEEIFVPFGTGGTAAGLAIGLALGGLRTRVVAVRVIDRLLANRPRLLSKARAIFRLCRGHQDRSASPAGAGSNLSVLHDFIGTGYGHPTPLAEEAVALFFELEGLKLETTYTGKAAAAFLRRSGQSQGPLLFWFTYSSADLGRWVEGRTAVPGDEP